MGNENGDFSLTSFNFFSIPFPLYIVLSCCSHSQLPRLVSLASDTATRNRVCILTLSILVSMCNRDVILVYYYSQVMHVCIHSCLRRLSLDYY